MQTIVLVMRHKPIAQSLVGRLQDNPDAQIIHASDYDNSEAIIFNSKANVVLIEAAESGDYGIAYCLELCERLRKDAPKCMLLLMCPEQDENSITRVVEAKRKKRIDDFVFYDVTIEYLISKLMSMYPSNDKYEMLRGEHNYGSN